MIVKWQRQKQITKLTCKLLEAWLGLMLLTALQFLWGIKAINRKLDKAVNYFNSIGFFMGPFRCKMLKLYDVNDKKDTQTMIHLYLQ